MSGISSNNYLLSNVGQDIASALYRYNPTASATVQNANNVTTVSVGGQTATVTYANGVATVTADGKATTVTSYSNPVSLNAATPKVPNLTARAPDTISLSAPAQAWLTNDQIAARLIEDSKSASNAHTTDATTSSKQKTASPQPQGSATSTPTAGDVPSTAATQASQGSSPSLQETVQSVANLVAQAQLQVADPNYVYNEINATGGLSQEISSWQSSGVSQSVIDSFVSAFNNKTLNVQTISQIQGVNSTSGEYISTTNEHGIGGENIGLSNLYIQQKAQGISSIAIDNPIGGEIWVSWPSVSGTSSSSGTSSATSTTAAPSPPPA